MWWALYRWLLDLGHGVICGILLNEAVILCGIDIFYMVCMLRRIGAWMGVGSNLEEKCWASGGRMLSSRPQKHWDHLAYHRKIRTWLEEAWVEGALLVVVCRPKTYVEEQHWSVGCLSWRAKSLLVRSAWQLENILGERTTWGALSWHMYTLER